MKYIVVDGYEVEKSSVFEPMPMDSAYTFSDTLCDTVSIDGNKLVTGITISIMGTDEGQSFSFSGGGTLAGSAQKVTADSIAVMLEEDNVDCMVTVVNLQTGVPLPALVAINVKIKKAGQKHVKAD